MDGVDFVRFLFSTSLNFYFAAIVFPSAAERQPIEWRISRINIYGVSLRRYHNLLFAKAFPGV